MSLNAVMFFPPRRQLWRGRSACERTGTSWSRRASSFQRVLCRPCSPRCPSPSPTPQVSTSKNVPAPIILLPIRGRAFQLATTTLSSQITYRNEPEQLIHHWRSSIPRECSYANHKDVPKCILSDYVLQRK